MPITSDYRLESKYDVDTDTAYLNGTQALVRLLLNQAERDRRRGHNTAGFVSGYRGSPLGGVDIAMWDAAEILRARNIVFQEGLNEDLAATSLWGTQQVGLLGDSTVDGVFGLWYGKGPGVDRSADALKHGSAAGATPMGGVLVVVGDDHAARSSTLAHQSDGVLAHCAIPVLNPATTQEILDYGILGWELSRFSGAWVALKCVTDVVEVAQVADVAVDRVAVNVPGERMSGPARWTAPGTELEIEVARRGAKIHEFARANALDRAVFGSDTPRTAIVTTGKAHGHVMEVLRASGMTEESATAAGLGVFKVGLSWPLDPLPIRRFAASAERLAVIEEKQPYVETQIATALYASESRPRLYGNSTAAEPIGLPSTGELDTASVAAALERFASIGSRRSRTIVAVKGLDLVRKPTFCAGCPHNTSTVVPEGSHAQGGIGCHGMTAWMPERRTHGYTQMGGEGANWIGHAPFTATQHIFQNLGDGTYFHSGSLAVRAAVAAGINITYKILVNGAVAMTGGQPIEGHEVLGQAEIAATIARQLVDEGVVRVRVVTDDGSWPKSEKLPTGVTVHHRDAIDAIQRELRDAQGVTAIVYTQVCAAEARRLRKRGVYTDPDRRVVIHEKVCEGCGDCSVQSNCIAVEPVDTEFGRKRQINQTACNKDYSCLRGYCPSFVVIENARLRPPTTEALDSIIDSAAELPIPAVASTDEPWNILVSGIGGTGVVTVGALLGVAAHIDGMACSVLDVTGLAQKGGPVASHVRVATSPDRLYSARLTRASADLMIGCDLVVSTSQGALELLDRDRTAAVVNTAIAPTSDFATNPDLDLSVGPMLRALQRSIEHDRITTIDAESLARRSLGDAVVSNVLLLGAAAQLGLLPVSLAALDTALRLNGSRVPLNRAAFALGRLTVAGVGSLEDTKIQQETLGSAIERLANDLKGFQDETYAQRFRHRIGRFAEHEVVALGADHGIALQAARSYHKVLAYKDEYEVARLYRDPSFKQRLDDMFEPGYRVKVSLAPQRFFRADPTTGRVKKRLFGPTVFVAFRLLAGARRLRGGRLDIFGRTPHRARERSLIAEFEADLDLVEEVLAPHNADIAAALVRLPETVRGFGIVKDQALAKFQPEREVLRSRISESHVPGAAVSKEVGV